MNTKGFQIVDAIPYLSPDLVAEITKWLVKCFGDAQQARRNQIDGNYMRWLDNYSAKPNEAVRTTPWYRASNFIPQLIRMHTDILTARMVGIMFGTKPFWKPTAPMGMVPHQELEVLSNWLEFETFNRMNFFNPIHSGVMRTFKTGTNIFKGFWKDLNHNRYRVVTGVGAENTTSPQFREVSKEGFCLEAVPFEDFYVYPITVDCLAKVQVKFHRLRFDERQVKDRQRTGTWRAEACDFLLRQGDFKPDPARQSQAEEAGIILTKDISLPFNVVECWFDYTLPDGGKYKLVAVVNPAGEVGPNNLLRMYFNPDSRGEDPFIDQRAMPREDFFYGYSVPEILEQAQEEQAQIHNHRRDANTIANNPGWKKKRLGDVPNPSQEWYPGRVMELDNMDDLEPLQFGGSYNAMIEEEAFLLELTNKYTGISPAQQAMGAGVLDGKRGVYSAQGTMAMLSQGSDRPDLYLKQFREPFHLIGSRMRRAYANYSTTIPFELWGEQGMLLQAALARPEADSYDPVFFAIGASDGSANKEVDRTNLLLMANTMAGYYNQVFQLVSTISQLPPEHPLYQTSLMVLDGAKDLTDRLLFIFDIGDRSKLVPDVRALLGGSPGNLPTEAGGAEQSGLPEASNVVPFTGLEALSRSIAQLPR